MLAGVLSLVNLPVEQYPNIAPPSVSINTQYPGASAKTIENSVTQVIEQSLTGIDHMRYFVSDSNSAGLSTIVVTFDPAPELARYRYRASSGAESVAVCDAASATGGSAAGCHGDEIQ